MTSDLPNRSWQHREGEVEGFSKQHGVNRLIYYEFHETMEGAITREKQLKKWNRAWKIRLIEESNPNWDDLYDQLAGS